MDARDWRQLGLTLYASGKYTTAIAAFLRARALGESDAEFHRELASSFWSANDRDSAFREIFLAQEKDKNSYAIAFTIGNMMAESGNYAAAAKWLGKASELDPSESQARFNKSLYLLASGDWENGWKEYETRLEKYPLDFPAPANVPLWKNTAQSLDGKLIWVTSEQGQGDQIQFSRYMPWLRAQGAGIIFDSHAELADFSFAGDILTRTMGPAGKWKVPELEGRKPDYYIPLMSLASRHRTTPRTVPPPPKWYRKVAESFRVKIPESGKKRVGLVWAGAANHPGDNLRSMPIETLIPITANNDIDFFSFQIGKRATDIKDIGGEPLVKNILPLALWSQTCAALLEMDALVTVDTAIAHIAGSLGVKTYMMVSTQPDWRWGTEGDTTPWYPSIKIVRQKSRGDWRGVVRDVAQELELLCAEDRKVANA